MPLETASADLVEEAFYDRAQADADLVDALGHAADDEAIVRGRKARAFDVDEPAARHFPLLSYSGIPGTEWGGGYGGVTVRCHLFAWPRGEDGGIEKIREVDAALLGLFHKEAWTFRGRRFMCRRTNSRPGASDVVLHRIRELNVGVGG